MKKYLNLILVVYLISSCSKNPENIIPTSNECINEFKDTTIRGGCKFISGNFPNSYCDVQHIDEFVLDEGSKEYLPQFCQQIGSLVKYRDDKGQIIIFTILDKWVKQNTIIYNHTLCEKDSMKTIGYCYGQEKVFMTLESETPKIRLYFELSTYPENGSNYNGRYGDELSILRLDSNEFYLNDFSAIVNKRTFSYDTFSNQEFFPNILLNGNNYMNVISYDSKYNYPTFKFYYNKGIGLIAFKDKTGAIWTLVE